MHAPDNHRNILFAAKKCTTENIYVV